MPKGISAVTSSGTHGCMSPSPPILISTNQGFKRSFPSTHPGLFALHSNRDERHSRRKLMLKAPGTQRSRKVSGKIVAAISFPLPPLAEQRRIVAKVDELMVLCDRLEAARAGREAVRDRLAAASLARLSAPDPETFQEEPVSPSMRCPPSPRAPTRSSSCARPSSASPCAASSCRKTAERRTGVGTA